MLESEKFTRGGEPMYPLGNKGPIAYCCLVANNGDNTNRPLYFTSNDLCDIVDGSGSGGESIYGVTFDG